LSAPAAAANSHALESDAPARSRKSTFRRRWFAAPVLAVAVAASAAACNIPNSSTLGWSAVVNASHQGGKPYVYGAAGPSSFDCSGLVQYVYGLSGRSLPRTAQEQYNAIQHISQSAKQPGDLLFWGAPYGVYHVGIYAGWNMMWDAPTPGSTVTFRPMWDNSYVVGRVS
jgi:cell wall-associated NlpC family hydrolase